MKFKTKNGYEFFEVTSAFQKSVRRGLEDDALYWGLELYKSGYREYVWKRIMVMTSEDIGLAEPELPTRINALYNFFSLFNKDEKQKEFGNNVLFVVQAILHIVRAKKSRLVDETCTLHFMFCEKHFGIKEIPDYALDMHTRRGRAKGRAENHFYQEAGKLANKAEVDREDEITDLVKGLLNKKLF